MKGNSELVNSAHITVASGFRRDGDEDCALLGYYVALSGDSIEVVTGLVRIACGNVPCWELDSGRSEKNTEL
jgi:hypothetical protein